MRENEKPIPDTHPPGEIAHDANRQSEDAHALKRHHQSSPVQQNATPPQTSNNSHSIESQKVGPFSKIDLLIVLVIIGIALALRIIYDLQLRASPLFNNPILDGEVHDNWARAIVAGKSFFSGAYFKAPLYPWLLAAVYKIAGPGYLTPRLVQAVMGSLSCALLFLVGREAFGRVVGALAGLAAASFWVLIYFDGELLLEPLSVFLNLLALWLTLRARPQPNCGTGVSPVDSTADTPLPQGLAKGRRPIGWLFAGLAWGLSAINRPNVLLFMPVIAVWILWLYRDRFRQAIARTFVFGIACLIPIVPITIRNAVVGHDFVLIASQAGPNFYIGNNPQSDGISARVPGARSSWFGGYQDWITLADQESGRRLKPSEVSRFFFHKSFLFIRNNPVQAFNLMFRKLQLFFYEWEIPNNKDLYFFTRRYTPVTGYLPLTSGAVLSLGLLGLVLSLGQARRFFPVWSFALIYAATVIAFFVCARFRLPVMPIFILTAAYFVVRFFGFIRSKAWSKTASWAILAYLSWVGINRGVPEALHRKFDARSYCQIGVALAEAGFSQKAEHEYLQALKVDPNSIEAEINLGRSALNQGRFQDAAQRFEKVLTLDPQADVHEHLARALIMSGKWSKAIDILKKGLAAYPGYLDLKRKLAFVYATCPIARYRNGAQAVRLAEEVRDYGSEDSQTYDSLSVAYAEVGRFEEAIAASRHAMRLAESTGNAGAVQQISLHLASFHRRRPFRQKIPPSP